MTRADRRRRALDALRAVARWHFNVRQPDASPVPFYCDPRRVGFFAAPVARLARGSEDALFRLFVTLSMYQAQRDVVVMRRQRTASPAAVRSVADMAFLRSAIKHHSCEALGSKQAFDAYCDVRKDAGRVSCGMHPRLACHVKDATIAFRRTGDMGKIPSSAFLLLATQGGFGRVLASVREQEPSPTRRATLLVEHFSGIHRVGRKLATLFVSLLSTPALAPGLAPWFPDIDGNDLAVVDTNVARAVDSLRGSHGPRTYAGREQWIREAALELDLREVRSDLPRRSPRLVQEALYTFSSRSNRVAAGDPCATRRSPCADCAPSICPFVEDP